MSPATSALIGYSVDFIFLNNVIVLLEPFANLSFSSIVLTSFILTLAGKFPSVTVIIFAIIFTVTIYLYNLKLIEYLKN